MVSVIAVLRRIEQHGLSFHPSADIASENKRNDIILSREVGITYEDFEACLSMAELLYLHATHIGCGGKRGGAWHVYKSLLYIICTYPRGKVMPLQVCKLQVLS